MTLNADFGRVCFGVLGAELSSSRLDSSMMALEGEDFFILNSANNWSFKISSESSFHLDFILLVN